MKEPVTAPDGYVYEKSAILKWMERIPQSPVTQRPFVVPLNDNFRLAEKVKAFVSLNP